MCGAEVTACTTNLLQAMRFFGRGRPASEIRDLPGVCLISCGLNYAAFNAALLSQPLARDPNLLRDKIQTGTDHFRPRHLRWTYWLCDDYLDQGLRRHLRPLFSSFGLSPLTEPPGMFADRLLPPKRPMPELEVRPVVNEATRRAFAHITSVAFEIPHQICMDVYGSSRAWEGDFHGYVGYSGNLPVATTATVATANVVGIYSVGTLPHCRRRGYAEALVRQALALEKGSTGIEATVLQSTSSGLRLYQRMGYRRVTRFSVYIA